MAFLEIKGLGKNFGRNVAVNSIDMSIEKGEIRGLIGPNGSGKTTLFNLITGFIKPTRGRVIWKNIDITGSNKNKAIPIGFYTLGVKGFSGHISGLNQPGEFNPLNMDLQLAGIFSDITSKKWYRLEGTGHTIWPKEFNIKGEGQFLKPMDKIPYQLKGNTEMSYNVSENWLYMGFQGQCGTMDEKTWLIDGVGNLNITMNKGIIPNFSGNMEGLLTLP